MKASFTKLNFQSLVRKVGGVTGSQAANEILKHVMVQASPEHGVAMVGTDAELSAIARSSEPKVEVAGSAVLPIRQLSQIADLCGDEVNIEMTDLLVTVTTDGTIWRISSLDPTLYPPVPRVGDSARPLGRERLLKALELVRPAVGVDESRPSLLMVAFDNEGVYATDGSRVHFAAIPNDFESLHIPANAIRPLIDLLSAAPDDYIYIDHTETHVLFVIGTDEFTSRLLDASFPAVKASMIAPRINTHTQQLQVARSRLELALRRAAVTSDDGSGAATLHFGLNAGECVVQAQNLKGDRVSTSVEMDYKGAPRAVTYAIPSLLDVLAALTDDTIQLRLSPSVSEGSLLVAQDGFIAVLLPRQRQTA